MYNLRNSFINDVFIFDLFMYLIKVKATIGPVFLGDVLQGVENSGFRVWHSSEHPRPFFSSVVLTRTCSSACFSSHLAKPVCKTVRKS